MHQMTDAAFDRRSIGLAIVQGVYLNGVVAGIKGSMDVTALAVFSDNVVVLLGGELPS
jgi:hypothetical protein